MVWLSWIDQGERDRRVVSVRTSMKADPQAGQQRGCSESIGDEGFT